MPRPEQPPVASPCTGICTLDRHGEYCTGCHRTLDEIARWATMSAAERRMVRDRIRRELADE